MIVTVNSALRTPVVAGIMTACLGQATTKTCERQTQTLEFPSDRSLGILHARPQTDTSAEDFRWSSSSQWDKPGFAQGGIGIPANCFVRLDFSEDACKDLSPLGELPPGSIHYIEFETDAD